MAWTTMEIVMSEELKQRLHDTAQKQGKEIGEFVQKLCSPTLKISRMVSWLM